MRRLLILVFACIVSTSCGRAQPRFAAEQVLIFPGATEVRAFAFEDGAAFAEGGIEPDWRGERGVVLAANERDQLSRLVSTAPPPVNEDGVAVEAACACFYRHVFVFYGTRGEELGILAFCLNCQCAMRTDAAGKEVASYEEGYRWDPETVRAILSAHDIALYSDI